MTPTTTPTFLQLFTCLKRMNAPRHRPRLRFILPNKLRLDFFYIEDLLACICNEVYVYYREFNCSITFIGRITSDGLLNLRKAPLEPKLEIWPFFYDLQTNFTSTVTTYGQRTQLCALCGKPLIDPSSLKRGITLNCVQHLTIPPTAEDL